MSDDDSCFLSATDLRRHIGRKEISPLDVIRTVLARAERLQPELNCFITLCADEAWAQERGPNAGGERRLHSDPGGIPARQHIVNTKGVRTTGAIPQG